MTGFRGRILIIVATAGALIPATASTLAPGNSHRPGATASARAVDATTLAGTIAPVRAHRVATARAQLASVPERVHASRRGWLTARVLTPVLLRDRPGGARIARLGTTTEFGSPRVLSVVTRRGSWLGVTAPQTGNGRLGWVSAHRVRLGRVDRALVVELSRRQLVLRAAGHRTLRRVTVGIGSPGSPTPPGRYAITDLLRIRGSSPYGCCALALSGRQPRVPQDWAGGDRLAIHGTTNPRTIGGAASLGCLHAGARDLRALMRAVPLGAPVFVRA